MYIAQKHATISLLLTTAYFEKVAPLIVYPPWKSWHSGPYHCSLCIACVDVFFFIVFLLSFITFIVICVWKDENRIKKYIMKVCMQTNSLIKWHTPLFILQNQFSGSTEGSLTSHKYLHFLQDLLQHCTHVPKTQINIFQTHCYPSVHLFNLFRRYP